MMAADVLARIARIRGEEVFFLTGTDEHGQKVAEAAAKAGLGPKEFADQGVPLFTDAWKALDISHDRFIRTTDADHEAGVTEVLKKIHAAGALYEKEYEGLYCVGCEKFVTEKDLDENGLEPLHKAKPVAVKEKNWFFKLSEYLPEVKKRIESGAIEVYPPERKNEVLGLIEQGLEDVSVSRSRERVGWGIPLPFDDSQVAYVWFDALFNYLTALGYGTDGKKMALWPADAQIIGQDILKFHAVYWPAFLLALGEEPPRRILVHGFFTIDGQKISKTLGNVIDPLDLAKKYGTDGARYLIFSALAFGNTGDIPAREFTARYNADLANNIGNLVSRTLALCQKYADGAVPKSEPDKKFIGRIEALTSPVFENPDPGARLEAARTSITAAGRLLNGELEERKPWKEEDAAKRDAALATIVEGVAVLGEVAIAVLPKTAEKIQAALGLGGKPAKGRRTVPGGHIVPLSGPLFPKIEE